ncbi:uncharacterized protein LOC129230036 [Uloborus diversus]|uniref:uncharacterized protein LOC129230036 n=1 Tax=Uloborus diversus TaxID=327109 RepID=UPI0024096F46|nr:uncharacterized protein LOC129230036 [Uloborus diversus]
MQNRWNFHKIKIQNLLQLQIQFLKLIPLLLCKITVPTSHTTMHFQTAFLVLAVFLVTGECRQRPEEVITTDCRNQKDVEEYLDRVMERVRQDLPDPMMLPPRSTIVELSDGHVWGLSNLTRFGNTEVKCEGYTITISAKITTDTIKGRYTWTKVHRGKERQGYVVFISKDFEANVQLSMNYATQDEKDLHPRLDRFEIKRFKKVKVEITGIRFLTWALGEMTTLMSGIFQRAIAHAIEGPLTEALQMRMREISLD